MDRRKFCLSALLFACNGALPTVQTYGTQLALAECNYFVRCGLLPDQATCEKALANAAPQLQADEKAGRVSFDPKAAEACLVAIAQLDCAQGGLADVVLTAPGCASVEKGLVVEGGNCYSSNACSDGNCDLPNCATLTTCCVGKCRKLGCTMR